ncbi:hypothetical protein D3C84_311860 [compost metagenome]
MLKHHAHFATHPIDAFELAGKLHTVDDDASFLVFLQAIDAANQAGLARTGGPANDYPFALLDIQINIFQYLERSVPFAKPPNFHRSRLSLGKLDWRINGQFHGVSCFAEQPPLAVAIGKNALDAHLHARQYRDQQHVVNQRRAVPLQELKARGNRKLGGGHQFIQRDDGRQRSSLEQ